MTDERARAAAPLAARLIAAVEARDPDQVAHVLGECDDLPALAVVLADQASLPKSMPTGAPPVFTPEERRDAHARYYHGDRDHLTRLGEREYQRERKRILREEKEAPPADITGTGRWVNHNGIQKWIPNHDDQTGAVA